MLVHWRPPVPGDFPWDVVPRCIDRTACAERVKLAGDVWPLVERDRSEAMNGAKTPRPNGEAAARRREYDAWAAKQPAGLLDRRPPTTDPVTGNVSFAPPIPVPAIPIVAPATSGPAKTPAVHVASAVPVPLVPEAPTDDDDWMW
jgi:hypothetical protein